MRRLDGEDVLAIDLPGHGASPGEGKATIDAYTADVLYVMDHLGIDQAVIAGHSMGGAIAQRLCLDYPERVRALILLGTGARLSVHPKLIQYCSDESTYPKAVSLVVKWAFSQGADKRLVELAGERMVETPASVMHGDFIACDAFDMREKLSEIEKPTLVICGADDKMTPARFSQYLSKKIPRSRLEIVPNAGHMVMLEQPDIVAHLVKGFLVELSSNERLPG
jgi:pimeloyl-ACP methyl ester carboxylesterase